MWRQKTCPISHRCPFIPALLKAYSPAVSWYASCTMADKTAPQRVIRSAQKFTNTELPSLEDVHRTRCLCPATDIIKDSSRTALWAALLVHQRSHFQIMEHDSSTGNQRFELQKTCSKRCQRKHFCHKVNWLASWLHDFSWVSSDLMMHELCMSFSLLIEAVCDLESLSRYFHYQLVC